MGNRNLTIVLIVLCIFSFQANAQLTQSGTATPATMPTGIIQNNTIQIKKEKDIWVADYYFNGLSLKKPQETTNAIAKNLNSTTKKAKVEIQRINGQSKTLVTVKLNDKVEKAFTIEKDDTKAQVFYIDKVNGKEIKVEFRNLEMKESYNQYACHIWTKGHNLLNKEKEVLTFTGSNLTNYPKITTRRINESEPFKIGVRVNCIAGCKTTVTSGNQPVVANLYIDGNDVNSERFNLYGNEQNKEFFVLVDIKASNFHDPTIYTIEFSDIFNRTSGIKYEVEVFSAETIESITNE